MNKIILLFCIIVFLNVFIFSGCFEEKKEISTEEIISNFCNAVNSSVNSYKYTTNGVSTRTVVDDLGSINITKMISYSNGTIDIVNQNLKLENEYIGENSTNQWKIYILDFFVYTGSGEDGNLSWETEHTSTALFGYEFWDTFSVLQGLAKGLANPQENITFERLDDEVLNGETYYIIQRTSVNNSSSAKYSAYSNNELQMKFWINKDTYMLYKTQSTMTSDETGIFSTWGNRSTIITEGQYNFYDINKPVIIELPSNVKKADDIYLKGFVEDDGKVKIQNQGGIPLTNYRIEAKYIINGTEIGNQSYNETEHPWKVHEYRYVFSDTFLLKEEEVIEVNFYNILDDGSEEQIYNFDNFILNK